MIDDAALTLGKSYDEILDNYTFQQLFRLLKRKQVHTAISLLQQFSVTANGVARANGEIDVTGQYVNSLETAIRGPKEEDLKDALDAMKRIGVDIKTNG